MAASACREADSTSPAESSICASRANERAAVGSGGFALPQDSPLLAGRPAPGGDLGQPEPRRGETGVQRQGPAVSGPRFLDLSRLDAKPRELEVEEIEPGIELQRFAERPDRLPGLSGGGLCLGQPGEKRNVAGAALHEAIEGNRGFACTSPPRQFFGLLELVEHPDAVLGIDRARAAARSGEVAEPAERVGELRRLRRRGGPASAAIGVGDDALETPDGFGLLAPQVAGFRRVRPQVIEFGTRGDDQSESRIGRGRERAPTVGRGGHVCLAVDGFHPGGIGPGLAAGKSGPEGSGVGRQPGEAEQRRGQPPRRGGRRDDAARNDAGTRNHERHLERCPIEKDAVLLLAVLAEHLPMVTDGRDDPMPAPGQTREEATDLPIDVRDLPVVALRRAAPRPIPRRLVRSVGVVVVHPQEVGAPGRKSRCPLERGAGHGLGVALRVALLAGLLGDDRVVVYPEPAGQSESAVENPRGDHRAGRVSPSAERGRQCRHVLRQ